MKRINSLLLTGLMVLMLVGCDSGGGGSSSSVVAPTVEQGIDVSYFVVQHGLKTYPSGRFDHINAQATITNNSTEYVYVSSYMFRAGDCGGPIGGDVGHGFGAVDVGEDLAPGQSFSTYIHSTDITAYIDYKVVSCNLRPGNYPVMIIIEGQNGEIARAETTFAVN